METQTGGLTIDNLISPRENTYFYVLLTVAIIIWLMVAASMIGIVIVGILALAGWLAHGLLVARLRSESVLISPLQYPDLYKTFTEVCARLQVPQIPELYILQSGGLLNAFATRHAGRNFVVINSSFVEVLGASTPMMKFLMGHEIGHIQRKHLTKRIFIAPGGLIPLVGEAYHRACEATCDRFGAYASDDIPASMLALTVLASGREASNLNTGHFAAQHFNSRDFFVSWHELIINYPTLSQRVALLLGLHDPQYARGPARRFWAYPLAFIFSLFSVKNIIFIYIAVVAISVLIALGNQVKKTEADIQDKLQQQQQSATPQPAPASPPPAPASGQ